MKAKKPKIYKLNPQQVKFMTSAGFKLEANWKNTDELSYWQRGEILICMYAKEKVNLMDFTDKVIGQSVYRAKKAFSHKVTWEVFYYQDDVNNLFKTKNEV